MDSLHDLIEEGCEDYHKAVSLFRNKGCEAFGCSHNPVPMTKTADVSSLMFEVLGDDTDGIASMMDDFDFVGWLD